MIGGDVVPQSPPFHSRLLVFAPPKVVRIKAGRSRPRVTAVRCGYQDDGGQPHQPLRHSGWLYARFPFAADHLHGHVLHLFEVRQKMLVVFRGPGVVGDDRQDDR